MRFSFRLPTLRLPALLLLASSSCAFAAPAKDYDGLVIPFKDVVVSAPAENPDMAVQSILTSIFVKEGDRVTVGEPLAQIYSHIEELDMLTAKADLDKKQFDFEGSKRLYAEKVMSETDALKIKSDLEVATLTYQRACEIYKQRTILSPIDGIVVEKRHEVGETMPSNEPVFRVLDVTQVYVQFYIRAEDLPLLHPGAQLQVRCPVLDPDRVFTGTVDFIDPRIDAASGLMRVKVLVPNADGAIKAGVRAKVTIAETN